MTFSISARCAETGQFGVAVSTKLLCVGQLCPFPRAGVGAVATQSFVNPYIGMKGGDYLAQGLSAQETLDRLAQEDDGRDWRQFAVVDREGDSAAYTGASCVAWCGHKTGRDYAAAGNMLVNAETVGSLGETFEATAGKPLAERLVLALEAAQAAGGDKRGRQSAALKVVDTEDYPLIDIRVDDSEDPVPELRRIWGLYQSQGFGQIMHMLPSKAVPAGTFDLEEIKAHLPK